LQKNLRRFNWRFPGPPADRCFMRSLVMGAESQNIFARFLVWTAAIISLNWPAQGRATDVSLRDLGIDPAILNTVKDNSPFDPSDTTVFYQLLAAAKRSPALADIAARDAKQLANTARPLFVEPSLHRGELLRLRGVAVRIQRVSVADAATQKLLSQDHYFQVDLFTSDSQDNPLVACVTELPEGLAAGNSMIRQPIELSAYFYKLWQYPTPLEPGEATSRANQQIAMQSAPLCIGKTIRLLATGERRESGNSALILAVLGLGILGVGMLLWVTQQADRDFFDRWIVGPAKPQ
jgi:hypothetical protein